MIGTGKYNFPGIRKVSRKSIDIILASTGWGAWLLASAFAPAVKFIEEWASEWLANKGLLIIDVGAIYVQGEFDQSKFDKAFDTALEQVKMPGLTDAQKKEIDAKVIDAFRRFGRIGNT